MDYIQIKEESLKGNITDELFPYLWEYMEYKLKQNSQTNLCKDYGHFVQKFAIYINSPIVLTNKGFIQPYESLLDKLKEIFEYLDTIHKPQENKEATEK